MNTDASENAAVRALCHCRCALLLLSFARDWGIVASLCKKICAAQSAAIERFREDISVGEEAVPIPYRGDPLAMGRLLRFRYSCTLTAADGEGEFFGCSCSGTEGCRLSDCSCKELNESIGDLLCHTFECHERCCCAPNCALRATSASCSQRLYVKNVEAKGFGVFAEEAIPMGAFIVVYVGERIGSSQLTHRRRSYDACGRNYVLSIDEHFGGGAELRRTHIDSTRCGNVARFFNHSCSPNLELRVTYRGSMTPIPAFFAMKAITRDEELTFRYCDASLSHFASAKKCLCGASNCCGFLPAQSDAP